MPKKTRSIEVLTYEKLDTLDFPYISAEHTPAEPLKKHYHYLFRLDNPVYISSFSRKLGIPENLANPIRNFKKALLYLTHADSPEKHPVPLENVFGTPELLVIWRETLEKFQFDSFDNSFFVILELFESHQYSLARTARAAAKLGLLSKFLRVRVILLDILNERVYNNKQG